MAKKKKKTVRLAIDLSSIYSEQVAAFWKSEPETMDLNKAVKAAMKDARHHFTKERAPWPLTAPHYAEDIATKFIGISPYKLAAAELADVANLVIDDGKIQFVAKKKKRVKK